MASIVEESSTKSARDHIATLALSIYQIHGLPAPGTDELGSLVLRAEASMGRAQLRHPDSITAPAIAEINQLVLRAADAKARPTNIYSAEGARAEAAGGAPVRKSGIDADRLEQSRFSRQQVQDAPAGNPVAGDSSGSSSSGARYDGMGSSDWGSPAGLARMRDYAIQSGLPWAANNPDLLRLGPSALGTLAAVHLQQDTYKSLTSDASFKAKDVVVMAHFAKDQHLDANKIGHSFAKAEKEMTPEERARLNGAVLPYMADPKSAEKRATANKAFDNAENAHPEKHEDLENLREQIKLKGNTLEHVQNMAATKDSRVSTEASRAVAKDTRAEGREAGAAGALNALDALGPETKPRAPTAKDDEKPKAPAASPPKAQPPKAAAPAPH